MDQAKVAFLDEVGERQARPLVLTGDGDHEAEVGVDELGGGILAGHDLLAEVALLAGCQTGSVVELLLSGLRGLDDLSEAHLVGLGEQGEATRLVQVKTEEVGTGAHGAPCSAAREIVHRNEGNVPASGFVP